MALFERCDLGDDTLSLTNVRRCVFPGLACFAVRCGVLGDDRPDRGVVGVVAQRTQLFIDGDEFGPKPGETLRGLGQLALDRPFRHRTDRTAHTGSGTPRPSRRDPDASTRQIDPAESRSGRRPRTVTLRAVRPSSPIGRGNGLKHRPVSVRVRVGAPPDAGMSQHAVVVIDRHRCASRPGRRSPHRDRSAPRRTRRRADSRWRDCHRGSRDHPGDTFRVSPPSPMGASR